MKHLLFVLCWLPLSLCAQVFDAGSPQLSWSDFVEEYLEVLDDESEEANVLTLRGYAALDEIEPFLDHPLNLNTATAEDFRVFAFLSAAQIDSLLSYRRRLRAFASPGELMGVRGLDYRSRRWLSLFTFVGDTLVASPNWRKRWFSGRHSLEMRAELPLYHRKGFRPSDREELLRKRSQFFLGPNLGTALRYRYAAQRELQWGLSFENDVGEPFAAHGHRPFDHAGAFVTYRARDGKWSWLETIVWHSAKGYSSAMLFSPIPCWSWSEAVHDRVGSCPIHRPMSTNFCAARQYAKPGVLGVSPVSFPTRCGTRVCTAIPR